MSEELIDSILKWWEEHQNDTIGDYGHSELVYYEEPEFVRLAKLKRKNP